MENLVIRRVRIEDAKEIGRIQGAITNNVTKIDFAPTIQEQVDNACFAAEIEGKVVGFMISYVLRGGFGLERSAWITNVGVDPKYMGQGIGKALAQEVIRVYKDMGITHIYTSVRWDSVDLLSFFRTLGFDRSNFINLRKQLTQ